jgi:hypothetical protein
MSRSFIKYHNHGYWIPDAITELLAQLIIRSSGNLSAPDWYSDILAIIESIASGEYGNGTISFCFDDYLTESYKIDYFVSILKGTKEFLIPFGKQIDVKTLNQWDKSLDSGKWYDPFETEKMHILIDNLILLLIERKGFASNSSESDYPLLPYGRIHDN